MGPIHHHQSKRSSQAPGKERASTAGESCSPSWLSSAYSCMRLLQCPSMHCAHTQALKILNDETQCDIIKIGGLIRNKVSRLRPHLFLAYCPSCADTTMSGRPVLAFCSRLSKVVILHCTKLCCCATIYILMSWIICIKAAA